MRVFLLSAAMMTASATVFAAGVSTFAGAKGADMSRVVIADLPSDGTDASAALQSVIDRNPNKTIFIPDGTYILGSPVRTCAKLDRSVALQLSDKTVLKAAPSWNSDMAMITMGSPKEVNTTAEQNYFTYIDGGTIDCSGVAKGIATECGRNLQVRNLSIIDTQLGFSINNGTNSGSSDADIFNLRIVGNNKPGSVGVRIHGFDNTVDNIDISGVQFGILAEGGGVMFRDIDITCSNNPALQEGSVGVRDGFCDNWYVNVDIKGFATAFSFENAYFLRPVVDNATVSFKGSKAAKHTVFASPKGGFHGYVRNMDVKTAGKAVTNIVEEKDHNGQGRICDLRVSDPAAVSGRDHMRYMRPAYAEDLAACKRSVRGCTDAAYIKFPSRTVVANVAADGKTDVSDALQQIIDANPGATIYLPDGKYALGKTVTTSSKKGKNTALRLGNFAILMPLDGFQGEYLLDMGADCAGAAPSYLDGGTIDCLGKVNGLNIASGDNSVVRYTVMLHAPVAMHIGKDARGTSVLGVNPEGSYAPDCVGVIVDGPESVFNLMRINDVHTGMLFRSSGCTARNIHPLTYNRRDERGSGYATTTGVVDEAGGNYYDYYYPDHFAIGFHFKGNAAPSVVNNGFCYHYADTPEDRTEVLCDGAFNSLVSNLRADLTQHGPHNGLLRAGKPGGEGVFYFPFVQLREPGHLTEHSHESYTKK